jgi:NAD(P)-dependent dehydrogenase (short-subunit alcohol dehydrogenase family)
MFAKAKSEFGNLNIFVSNARTEVPSFYSGPLDITLDQWDTAMNSQAKAFLVGVREGVALMKEGGRIIATTYAPGGRTGSWQPWVVMGRKSCVGIALQVFRGCPRHAWNHFQLH